MNITKIKHVKDCFNGTQLKEVFLDGKCDEHFILSVGKSGKLAYYKDFARPFFKVNFRQDFYVKGVLGNHSIRLLIKDTEDIDQLKVLIKQL